MIAAEELDLAMSQMKFLRNDTNVTPDQGTTAGSSAISGGGKQVRAAAAAARSALLDLAAAKLGIAKVLTNTYRYHYNGHLPIGPSCCVADVTTAGARIFSNTQNAYGTRSAVALVTGLPAERIRVSYYEGSSVYGSSPQTDVAQHVAARRQACAA